MIENAQIHFDIDVGAYIMFKGMNLHQICSVNEDDYSQHWYTEQYNTIVKKEEKKTTKFVSSN